MHGAKVKIVKTGYLKFCLRANTNIIRYKDQPVQSVKVTTAVCYELHNNLHGKILCFETSEHLDRTPLTSKL